MSDKLKNKIESAMEQHDTGCLVMVGTQSIGASYWDKRNDTPPKSRWLNFLSGVGTHAIQNGVTKQEILDNLSEVLRDAHQ